MDIASHLCRAIHTFLWLWDQVIMGGNALQKVEYLKPIFEHHNYRFSFNSHIAWTNMARHCPEFNTILVA